MGAERAEAQQQRLIEFWQDSPPISEKPLPINGTGGVAHPDQAVAVGSAEFAPNSSSPQTKNVFVAGKVWVGNWALVMRRYTYETGHTLPLITSPPVYFPGEIANPGNYFVPTAMKVFAIAASPGTEVVTASDVYVLVTGYSPAPEHGVTDFHTVCFNGELIVNWAVKHSKPLTAEYTPFTPDEYPVAIDATLGARLGTEPLSTTLVVGVTGNSWNGTDWDSQTVFHDAMLGGSILRVVTEESAGGFDDRVCGIKMFTHAVGGIPGPIAFVVGTQGEFFGNRIFAYRYSWTGSDFGSWLRATRNVLSPVDTQLTANAMTAVFRFETEANAAFVAGKNAGIAQSSMFMAKLSFSDDPSYNTSFTFEAPGGVRNAEALTMDYLDPVNTQLNVSPFIALGGYAYRDAEHQKDPLIVLWNEDVGQPVLRWSSWLNLDDTAFAVDDVCSLVKLDTPNAFGAPGSDDNYLVCAAGQLAVSATDMDWRMAVLTTSDDLPVVPTDPSTKIISEFDRLEITGDVSGADRPRAMELDSFVTDQTHNFIVVGDVWNGLNPGFDILTRRFRYFE